MGRSSFSDSLLTRVRHYFGISQEELARYLDVSGSLLSLLESGRRAFSPEVTEKLFELAKFEQSLNVGQRNPGVGMAQASVIFF